MQQFVVPQFISVEAKVLGPITVRQFLILLVAGGLAFLFFSLFDTYLFLALSIIVGLMAIVLAFIPVRGQPFHYFILNVLVWIRKPSMRVWNKKYSDKELNALRKDGIIEAEEAVEALKQPTRSHIRQLSLQVNTGGYYDAANNTSVSTLNDIDIG
jgi:hypothetical protein